MREGEPGKQAFDQVDFMEAQGSDEWFGRNARAIAKQDWSQDVVIRALAECQVTATAALEVGCADGSRLAQLAKGGATAVGIEPGRAAVDAGRRAHSGIELIHDSHRGLAQLQGEFDVIILGFCLMYIPPSELFPLAASVDRLLVAGGHLAMIDFLTPAPVVRPSSHGQGVRTFKSDHAKFFAGHPQYLELYRKLFAHSGEAADIADEQERVSVAVLKKLSVDEAYRLVPL